MTLQWTVVATFLYVEIVVLGIFLLPWIRPRMWQKLFKSRLVCAIGSYARTWSWAGAGVLLLFFVDGIREVRKYAGVESSVEATLHAGANADAVIHMRLFRAQRNLYISGFALFLWLILRRMVALLSREAQLEASAAASLAQAKSASEAAKKIMDDSGPSRDNAENKEILALRNQIEALTESLKKKNTDLETMKKQSQGLQREFDRVSDELTQASKSGGDKKSD